jgi:hemolysin activation/secretion protein
MIAGLCRYAAALVLIGTPVDAVAQVIPQSAAPGQQRERFVQPPAVQAQPRGSLITLPSTLAPPGAETIKLTIRGVTVVGATVYSEEDFAPLYADLLGREVPLQAVYDLAQRITAKYGRDGYVLTRAVVPPQNLKAGGAVVRIQVIEGYIDKVVWPQKLARFRDFFTYYAAKIVADRPANIHTLERYLLLLGDLPGFKVSTKLQPSTTELASSTLVVEVTEKPLDVSGRVDNHGSQPQGPGEFLGSATVNNILGGHEAFTATYAGAMPLRELQYAAATYRQVLSPEGLTAYITGSYTWGWPGLPVPRRLLYKTWNPYAEAGLSYPMVRSREKNLTLTGLAFLNDASGSFFDNPNAFPSTRDRLRGVQFKADGDLADQFRGINQVNVTFSQGIEGLGSTKNIDPSIPDDQIPGAVPSRHGGRVDFSKLEFTYSRMQPLFWNLSAFVSVYGQHAFNPLLTPELCAYGGRFYGRAYDPSQLLGDSCLFELGELRLDMPTPPGLFSLAQLYAFADHGRLTNIQPDFLTPRVEDGTSVGGGIRFGWANQLNTDFYVARALQGVPLLGVREDTRVFFIATARN